MQVDALPAGTIAVGVDASTASAHALTFAVDQAVAERRPLTLVHALGASDALWVDQEGHDNRIGVADAVDTGRLLASLHRVVAQRAPALEVHEVLRVADPRDVLLAVAEKASLVVVGSRGRGPVRTRLLGSVGVAVTRHATCPVIVVRPGNPGLVRRGVLVGVDGTERSQPVLDFAFRQASIRDLPLTVLHTFWDAGATRAAADRGDEFEEQQLVLSECLGGLREKYPDVAVRTDLARGLPDQFLVPMGDTMNMVVVGSHHGGAAMEVLFGSVTARVVEHATCPVAVVPTGPRE